MQGDKFYGEESAMTTPLYRTRARYGVYPLAAIGLRVSVPLGFTIALVLVGNTAWLLLAGVGLSLAWTSGYGIGWWLNDAYEVWPDKLRVLGKNSVTRDFPFEQIEHVRQAQFGDFFVLFHTLGLMRFSPSYSHAIAVVSGPLEAQGNTLLVSPQDRHEFMAELEKALDQYNRPGAPEA